MAYKKIEEYCEDDMEALEKNYKSVLGLLGEDPEREGLLKTPHRIAKAMQFMTHGYKLDAKKIINSAKFHEQNSVTTTSAFSGEFERNETRTEFLKLISSKLH